MNDLWEFTKNVLQSYPVGVRNGTLGSCSKLTAGSWEGGLELEKSEAFISECNKEMATLEFFGLLDDSRRCWILLRKIMWMRVTSLSEPTFLPTPPFLFQLVLAVIVRDSILEARDTRCGRSCWSGPGQSAG